MNLRKFILASVVLLVAATAYATFNYEYGADEYVTISNGISPDGRLAITAHGQGELGEDNFHLYLFDAVASKKIGPLEEISEVLDTGAGAFAAQWKKDSSEAIIIYRVDRHKPLKAMAYRFDKGRAFPMMRRPMDVRDNDPLIRHWKEQSADSRSPERTFGTPKPRS